MNAQTPIFMGHGTEDEVVHFPWGKGSFDTLKSLDYNVDFRSYRGMGHSSCPQEMEDLLNFLTTIV